MKHIFQPRRAAIAALALGATLGLALPAQAAVPQAELDALVDLYFSTNGGSWADNTNWNTGDPCDNAWHGITCDAANDHVTEIRLYSNNLEGTLSDLSQLTALEYFNVGQNRLSGSIPALTGLTALKTFVVASNHNLSGPIPNLTGLSALNYFDANNNQLTGPIPSLSGLTALVSFLVSHNQLTGDIPDLSGTRLLYFDVANNQLTGTILGLPTTMRGFRVDNNQLTGTPPAAPASLEADGSSLCPNFLHTPAPTPADDTAWNTATGGTWSDGCTPGYLVSTEAGAGGSIDPSRAVVTGQTTTITVTPDATHLIDTVTSTCGGALNGSTWTTAAINTDCLVSATFKAKAGAAVTSVPTLGEWALMLLAGLLAGLGLRRLPRQHG